MKLDFHPGGGRWPHEEQGNNGRHIAEVNLVKGRHHWNGKFQGHEGAGNCGQHTGVNKFLNTPFCFHSKTSLINAFDTVIQQ